MYTRSRGEKRASKNSRGFAKVGDTRLSIVRGTSCDGKLLFRGRCVLIAADEIIAGTFFFVFIPMSRFAGDGSTGFGVEGKARICVIAEKLLEVGGWEGLEHFLGGFSGKIYLGLMEIIKDT